MKNILVTGGAGYIGSHACKALATAGYRPVVFDNFGNGWRDAVKFGPAEEGDLLDADRIRQVLETWKPDAVMHFAALIEVGVSVGSPQTFWRNNVTGTMNLLDAMLATSTNNLVFSSTCAVNGDQDGVLLDETSALDPASPYANTKLAAERMISDYTAVHDLRSLAFRYFNVAGADPDGEIGEHHRPETHLIPLVLDAVAGKRDALSVYGDDYPTPDGTCIRDYVHVWDLVAAHVAGLDYLQKEERAPVITLGTGRGFSVREVIDTAAKVTNASVPHKQADRRVGDPASLVCGSKLAHEALGWQAARSQLPTMIADAWAWAQNGHYEK